MNATELYLSRTTNYTFQKDYPYVIVAGVGWSGNDSKVTYTGSGTVLYSARNGNSSTKTENTTLSVIKNVSAGDTVEIYYWSFVIGLS